MSRQYESVIALLSFFGCSKVTFYDGNFLVCNIHMLLRFMLFFLGLLKMIHPSLCSLITHEK